MRARSIAFASLFAAVLVGLPAAVCAEEPQRLVRALGPQTFTPGGQASFAAPSTDGRWLLTVRRGDPSQKADVLLNGRVVLCKHRRGGEGLVFRVRVRVRPSNVLEVRLPGKQGKPDKKDTPAVRLTSIRKLEALAPGLALETARDLLDDPDTSSLLRANAVAVLARSSDPRADELLAGLDPKSQQLARSLRQRARR